MTAGFPGLVPSRSVPGDAETPSEPGREATGSEGDSDEQQAALDWLETSTAYIWQIFGDRHKDGKDW